jgi:hypothetical protein
LLSPGPSDVVAGLTDARAITLRAAAKRSLRRIAAICGKPIMDVACSSDKIPTPGLPKKP